MDSNLRSHYLQSIGITEWHLRHPIESSDEGYIYQLQQRGQTVGLLVTALNRNENEREREFRLLTAIIFALNLEITAEPNQFDKNQNIPAEIKFVLIFGKSFEQHIVKNNQDIHAVATYSLAELLSSPLLKAEVWNHLQKLRKQLAS